MRICVFWLRFPLCDLCFSQQKQGIKPNNMNNKGCLAKSAVIVNSTSFLWSIVYGILVRLISECKWHPYPGVIYFRRFIWVSFHVMKICYNTLPPFIKESVAIAGRHSWTWKHQTVHQKLVQFARKAIFK